MKKLTLAAATLSLAAATASADVNIIDNNQKVTVDCAKEKSVNIVGNKATVTLTGTCQSVNISGNKATVKGTVLSVNISGDNNSLVLDGVDGILLSGDENTITYKKGVKEKAPKVMDSGDKNSVTQTK
jgi:hypothetical protein